MLCIEHSDKIIHRSLGNIKGYDFMEIEIMCKSIYEKIIKGEFSGIVHSVFDNSFNVLNNTNLFYTFINSTKTMAPYCIKINEDISFIKLGIKPMMKVKIFSNEVIINNLNIKTEFEQIKIWDKKPNFNFEKASRENIYSKLKIIANFLLQKGKRGGVFNLIENLEGKVDRLEFNLVFVTHLNKADEFIKDRFFSFIDSYINEDIPNIYKKSKKIIGFGLGLTPAMDDFLSGLMIARLYFTEYLNTDIENSLKINKAIVTDIDNKTTLVSENMLKFASVGETNEDIRELIISILDNCSDNCLSANLEKVISFGETSGTDILLGIYVGSYIMLQQH